MFKCAQSKAAGDRDLEEMKAAGERCLEEMKAAEQAHHKEAMSAVSDLLPLYAHALTSASDLREDQGFRGAD
jgi:hypothetical protein